MRSRKFETLAIAGPTCTGKTSIVHGMEKRAKIPLTSWSFDEYDLYPTGSEAMSREIANPTITNWEDPALFDEDKYIKDLERIGKGLPVDLTTSSRESLQRGEVSRTIQPSKLNIVEGIFAFRNPRTIGLISLCVFVDIPMAEMVKRRLQAAERGGNGPWDDPDYIKDQMVQGTREYIMPQRDSAHIILDGMRPTQEHVDAIVAMVKII